MGRCNDRKQGGFAYNRKKKTRGVRGYRGGGGGCGPRPLGKTKRSVKTENTRGKSKTQEVGHSQKKNLWWGKNEQKKGKQVKKGKWSGGEKDRDRATAGHKGEGKEPKQTCGREPIQHEKKNSKNSSRVHKTQGNGGSDFKGYVIRGQRIDTACSSQKGLETKKT